MSSKLNLPCLRGRIGDWIYYIALLSFKEVANRVKLPKEIDSKFDNKDLQLGEWIQRDLDKSRTIRIVDYLKKQDQRFFNSIILGIYGGNPSWKEIEFYNDQEQSAYQEVEIDYISRSVGLLTLDGTESIFAIDGQHRAMGIRQAIKEAPKHFIDDEVPVIFVAHKTNSEGAIRTRRLFSTLNRYAKPVSESEIIALSEDNNCAVITRYLIDDETFFKDLIQVNKTRSISPDNKIHFTNILLLYDMVERITTNKKVLSVEVSGKENDLYTTNREKEAELKKDIIKVKNEIMGIFKSVPSFNTYLKTKVIDRKKEKTNLIFRPIGQNILFDVLKVAENHNKKKEALAFFSKDNFNLSHKSWKKIFWDEETNNIRTEKTRQRYASVLILNKIGIAITKTKKDKELSENFEISIDDI
jgi:DNA sulfur modification protein DndB